MRVSSINSVNSNSFSAKYLTSPRDLQYKKFISDMDKWTASQLKKIDSFYESGTREKEDAIEYLFFLRDMQVERKRKELFDDCRKHSFWQKLRELIF
jgi:hypothetical protein